MARRWTPQRFVLLRRVRVAACAASLVLSSCIVFGVTARKTVALTVNGETTTLTTYAMSVDRLLDEQKVDVKTHDVVVSTSGETLTDHAVVTVQSAYQTTITIDGKEVPFWTVATSAEQLLGFFEANEVDASRVTVNIDNVYNQLTGGLSINEDGPVTVIADGKSSIAPNGKLPAASILDSKGIVLNKEDRVSVEKNGDETILRVRRVTHGQETRTKTVPFDTITIVDANLAPGQTEIRQQGENGEVQQVYDVTYVDGEIESEELISETTTKIAVDQIIAIGPDASAPNNGGASNGEANNGSDNNTGDDANNGTGSNNDGDANNGGTNNSGNANGEANNDVNTDSGNSDNSNDSGSSDANGNADSNGGANNNDDGSNSGNDGASNDDAADNGSSDNDNTDNGSTDGGTDMSQYRLYHPTPAQAQAYAAGAAAQYGWTGQNWTDLVKLWTRESSWLWYAENPYSGAYGIPQSLPADKMASFGALWRDDAAVQIDWGLNYIAQRYGSPSAAWQHSEEVGWY